MTPVDMEALRAEVVSAALAWWRVPDGPPERWCQLAERFEAAAVELADACAALDAAQMSERGGP